MASMKIKKGDLVKVIAGKDKDKEGKVIAVNTKNLFCTSIISNLKSAFLLYHANSPSKYCKIILLFQRFQQVSISYP